VVYPSSLENCRRLNSGRGFESHPYRHLRKVDSIQLIESGEYHNLCEESIRKHVKKWLIHRNGNVCSICKQSEWMGSPIPLVNDHIDGNSQNCNLENFRLVCCNCDAQLPTYKSKNRGRGRPRDRSYYHRQQSNIRGRSTNPR
jgi:hypothetical protein